MKKLFVSNKFLENKNINAINELLELSKYYKIILWINSKVPYHSSFKTSIDNIKTKFGFVDDVIYFKYKNIESLYELLYEVYIHEKSPSFMICQSDYNNENIIFLWEHKGGMNWRGTDDTNWYKFKNILLRGFKNV